MRARKHAQLENKKAKKRTIRKVKAQGEILILKKKMMFVKIWKSVHNGRIVMVAYTKKKIVSL